MKMLKRSIIYIGIVFGTSAILMSYSHAAGLTQGAQYPNTIKDERKQLNESNKGEIEMLDEMKSTTKMGNCPAALQHSFKKLHSPNMVNLCSLYNGKPILIVNTASHCGYTKQFGGLEALYQKHKAQGLQVVGFASDSFNQEAKSEEKAAGICFKNYGVTFTMLAPTPVKGDNANAVFQYLASKSQAPAWNFNKYLVVPKGDSVEVKHFGSATKPEDIQISF